MNMKKIISFALLFVLMELALANGDEYNSRTMNQVKVFEKKDAEFCVRPLSETPNKDQIALQLSVESTYSKITHLAGNSSFADFIQNRWYKVAVYHTTLHSVNILDVKVDGRLIPFKKSTDKHYFSSAYRFKAITLLSKGRVQISNDCSLELNATKSAITSKSPAPPPPTPPPPPPPTTTTPPPPTTTARVTTTIPGRLGTTTTARKSSTANRTTQLNTTDEVSQPMNDPEGDEAAWWQFIYCLGDFNGFPVLGMLIIALFTGVFFTVLSSIFCKQCCCSQKPKPLSNDNIGAEGNPHDALLPQQSNHNQESPQDHFVFSGYYTTRNDMNIENLRCEDITMGFNPTSTSACNEVQFDSEYAAPLDRTDA